MGFKGAARDDGNKMAAARKLQQEIDKTLKKVQEGIEVFDNLWEQLHESEYQNQRDKFESELKKEIKRLQRYREQIKTWIASSDVKDKKLLLEARKSVEREMERFKAAEREQKTKAFSKEGLLKAAQNLDPKSKARQEVRDWMNSTVDKLNNQIDELESELEASVASRKKQKNSRVSQNEVIINRHKEHIQKLESLLRLLDNEQLEPDDFSDIRDFLDDYIERGQEDSDEFEDSMEYFYEGVADKMEASLTTVTSINKKEDKKAKAHLEKEEQKNDSADHESKTSEKTSYSPSAKSAHLKSSSESARQIESSGSGDKNVSSYPLTHTDQVQSSRLAHSDVGEGRQGPHGNRGNGLSNTTKHGGMGSWNYGSDIGNAGGAFQARVDPHDQQDRQGERTEQNQMPSNAFGANESHYSQLQRGSAVPHKGGDMQQGPYQQYQQDSSVNQLRYGDSSSHKHLHFHHNIHSVPQEQDRTWRSQAPRGKTVNVPASYPSSQPLALRDPSIYERFDGETLFFAFYYQPGTYNQYLAARALKKKNWRFNKQHNAWFQRLKEPTYVTNEHEQGSYIWFDHAMFHEDGSRGWRPRVRDNFVFEYADLENDVKV